MATYIHLIFCVIMSFLLPSHGADPGPLQDFCVADLNSHLYLNGFPCKNPSKVTSEDFFYQGLQERPSGFDIYGVNITEGDVHTFPGLNTLGLSMNRVTFLPGGLNAVHLHPRATELSLVTKGKIFVGRVSTRYILYWKVLTAEELFVIPPGLVHFQLNVGHGNARFYASFGSQNPGRQSIGEALFSATPSIPDEVLSKSFLVNKTIVDLIKSQFSAALKASY